MSEQNVTAPKMEKSYFSGIAVPVAIVLVGALIIFGISKMLATGKSHRDLVEELHSKTFGNRWVAAYELSKYLAASRIPAEDVPWVVENLGTIYSETQDARTRNFIVLAMGQLDHPKAVTTIAAGLSDVDTQVRFNSVVALGNKNDVKGIDWSVVENMLSEPDEGLQQVAVYTLANHKVPTAEKKIEALLSSSSKLLRYASAVALVNYKNVSALPVVNEIASLNYESKLDGELNGAQVEAMKLSIINVVLKNKWLEQRALIERLRNDTNMKVSTRAQEALNLLKN